MKNLIFFLSLLILLPSFISAQSIYKKGYIINQDNQKILGEIQIGNPQDPSGYYETVVFKNGNDINEYSPEQIKEFGIKNSLIFQSFSVPVMDRNHLVKPESETRKFLRKLNEGALVFYDLKMPEHYWAFYYKKDGEEIRPLKMERKSAENLRTKTGSYQLSDDLVINDPANGSRYDTGKRFFLFEKGMFELIPSFRQVFISPLIESGCDIEEAESIMSLTHRTIYSYVKTLKSCQKTKGSVFNKKGTRLNVSILAMGTTTPGIQSTFNKQRAIGGLVEIKGLNFSSRFSLAYGRFQFSEGTSSYLEDYLINARPTYRTDTMTLRVGGTSDLLRLGYHLRPQKSLRPFLYVGAQRFKLKGNLQDTQELRQVKNVSLTTFGIDAGAGIDWYFLKVNQLRFQVGYAKGVEYFIGYGINLTQ